MHRLLLQFFDLFFLVLDLESECIDFPLEFSLDLLDLVCCFGLHFSDSLRDGFLGNLLNNVFKLSLCYFVECFRCDIAFESSPQIHMLFASEE